MLPRDAASLFDVLEAAKLAESFVAGLDREAFMESLLVQSAVIRQIEVMGEAVKRLSEEFRASNPHIPWRKIAGMRDLLIHAYDHVDSDEVWNALKFSIPGLIPQLAALVSENNTF